MSIGTCYERSVAQQTASEKGHLRELIRDIARLCSNFIKTSVQRAGESIGQQQQEGGDRMGFSNCTTLCNACL